MAKKKKSNETNLRVPSSIRFTPNMCEAILVAARQIATERPGQDIGHSAAVRILVAEALIARKISFQSE